MRNIQVSDLVPVQVLLGIAKRVRTVATEIAKSKNVPIKTANEIGIPPPKVTQKQTEINLTLSKKLSAFEWGSGEHRTRGNPAKYIIRAKNYPLLVFEGTNEFVGKKIAVPSVMHPGVNPRPFLAPAKRQTRQQNLEDLRRTNLANTKLIIRGMARKV